MSTAFCGIRQYKLQNIFWGSKTPDKHYLCVQ
nr:MAG TPA: hypothetical protein [Bacteriophage sp.]